MSNNKEKEKDELIEVEILDPFENTDVITDLVFEGKKDVNIRDIQYMCDHISNNEGCEYCPLNSGRVCGYAILYKQFGGGNEINRTILNWLNDNPPTSYLMDIKEKMPNVSIDKYHIPSFCVQSIYGKNCCECLAGDPSKFDKTNMFCRKCWRTPMDDEIKKEYH